MSGTLARLDNVLDQHCRALKRFVRSPSAADVAKSQSRELQNLYMRQGRLRQNYVEPRDTKEDLLEARISYKFISVEVPFGSTYIICIAV